TFEEHVLGAGEADTDGAEGHRDAGLRRGVRVGADGHAGGLLCPLNEMDEAPELLRLLGVLVVADDDDDDFRRDGLELTAVDGAARAIDAHEVAFLEGLTGSLDGLLVVVDLDTGSAADANLAHLAGDKSGVRGDTTLGGEDTLC